MLNVPLTVRIFGEVRKSRTWQNMMICMTHGSSQSKPFKASRDCMFISNRLHSIMLLINYCNLCILRPPIQQEIFLNWMQSYKLEEHLHQNKELCHWWLVFKCRELLNAGVLNHRRHCIYILGTNLINHCMRYYMYITDSGRPVHWDKCQFEDQPATSFSHILHSSRA